MRVEVDRDRCISAGACVIENEDVFDQAEEDGVVILKIAEPEEPAWASVRRAAAACPAAAIRLIEQ